MAKRTLAGEWLAENSPVQRRVQHCSKHNKKHSFLAHHLAGCAKRKLTVKEFVEETRGKKSDECIFVPFAVEGQTAKVKFCGRTISAARYMALLTHGAPNYEGALVRHLCGNGHLSCVNPNHLVWGDDSENMADAVRHRKCATAAEKIEAASV